MMPKDHYKEYLVYRLSEAGILNNTTVQGGKGTLQAWIKTGKLKLRQRPHNRYCVVNDQEIEQIIKAFSEGGKGWWSYDHPDPLPEPL